MEVKKKNDPERIKKIENKSSLNVMYIYIYIYWTSPSDNTPQDTNCTDTCLLSQKLFKLDEPDMQDTAGEAGTNS